MRMAMNTMFTFTRRAVFDAVVYASPMSWKFNSDEVVSPMTETNGSRRKDHLRRCIAARVAKRRSAPIPIRAIVMKSGSTSPTMSFVPGNAVPQKTLARTTKTKSLRRASISRGQRRLVFQAFPPVPRGHRPRATAASERGHGPLRRQPGGPGGRRAPKRLWRVVLFGPRHDVRAAARDERLDAGGDGEATPRRILVRPGRGVVRIPRNPDAHVRVPRTLHRQVRARRRGRALRLQGQGRPRSRPATR